MGLILSCSLLAIYVAHFHARRWYVHVASPFPLAHHYRSILAGSSMAGIFRKSDYFNSTSRRKAALGKRIVLGLSLRKRGPRNHFLTAVAKVAA